MSTFSKNSTSNRKHKTISMKKTLLAVAILIGALQHTYASHLMGGQITARQLSGLTYEITLTVYRDTLGIPVYTQETLVYDSLPDSTAFLSKMVNVSPANNIMNGVEEYTYTDTITFPGDGQYKVSYTSCCRNAAITNLSMPGSENIYLYTIVTVGSSFVNSTPVMLNLPVTLASLYQPWVYNPLPFDADGDSLTWSLDVPWGGDTLPCAGYTLPAADSTGPFTLNPFTGEIDWTPNTTGNWNATVIVREYRGGAQIGEIRRDMQILTIVDTSNGNRLAFSGTPALQRNADGYYEYVIPANMPFHLVMNANDADGDILNMDAIGATFEKLTNPSVVTITSASGHAQAIFDWTPTTADVTGKPFLDVFRGYEYHGSHVFMSDLTVALRVVNTNGVSNLKTNDFDLAAYPNPAIDQLIIETNAAQETSAQINLCDLSGRVIATVVDGTIHTGRTLMTVQTKGLPAGVYVLSGMYNNERITNRKVVIE